MGNYEDAEQLLGRLREWDISDAPTMAGMAQAYATLAVVEALRAVSLDSRPVQAAPEERPPPIV